MSGTLTTAGVRRALRDRIAALSPKTSYTTEVALTTGSTWHESPTPLVPSVDPPDPVMPLAFWIVDDRQGRVPTRTGRDSILVESQTTIRFLLPSRPKGAMATAADDWDAAAFAAEHLLEHLTVPEWGEVIGLAVDLPTGDLVRRNYAGPGAVAILCEVYIIVRFELG